MTVIGYKESKFKGEDGTEITGMNIYCSYPINKGGEGVACERLYVTDAKLERCGYVPSVGDSVVVQYNKFGKVASIELA